jgi:hypothetical protein
MSSEEQKQPSMVGAHAKVSNFHKELAQGNPNASIVCARSRVGCSRLRNWEGELYVIATAALAVYSWNCI